MRERDDESLEALHAYSDSLSGGDGRDGGQWTAHAAVLDRLAAMRHVAEASGWTSLAIEREGPADRFRLFGVPPGAAFRAEVPDPFEAPPRDPRR